MKVKQFIIPTIAFTAGFLVHAVFFPYVFVDGKSEMLEEPISTIITRENRQLPPEVENDLITYVRYEKKAFKPSSVTITRGNYIAITNISNKEQMWLLSDNPLLNTVRGYAYGERLQTVIAEPGIYKVQNELFPEAMLEVTVK
jgi:hypothetical protein